MSETLHRFFFACRPPPPLAMHIEQTFLPPRQGRGWVRPEHLHVTLAITDDYRIHPPGITDALLGVGDSLAAKPVRLIFDQLVGSGSRLLLKYSEPIPALQQFQRRLGLAFAVTGLSLRAGWRFSPHMTLFHGAGQPFCVGIDAVSWTAGEFLLVHSLVGETRHDLLCRWPLNAAPPSAATPERRQLPVDGLVAASLQEGIRL